MMCDMDVGWVLGWAGPASKPVRAAGANGSCALRVMDCVRGRQAMGHGGPQLGSSIRSRLLLSDNSEGEHRVLFLNHRLRVCESLQGKMQTKQELFQPILYSIWRGVTTYHDVTTRLLLRDLS